MTINPNKDINEGKECNEVLTIPTSGIIRRLSNLERAFLWNPYSNAVIVVKIHGNVSEEKFKRSLKKVGRIHPFLGVKILFDENHDAWFSTDNVPSPDIKIVTRLKDTQWFGELQDNLQIPYDLEKGPLIRFILLHSEEVSDLIIISNHSICDGISLTYLIRDLLKNYTDPQQENRVTPPLDIMDFLPISGVSFSSIMIRLFVKYANWRWRKNPHCFTTEDYNALYRAYWEKNNFGTVLIEFEPKETESLSKLCKENGVSIGSAVATAFIVAYEDVIGSYIKKKKQISVPFDLRRHATTSIGDVFCLCAGASQFPYGYNVKKSFWENASILHKEIHKRVNNLDSFGLEVLDSDPTLLDALSCFAFFEKFIPDAYNRTGNLSRFSQDKKNIAFNMIKISEKMFPDTDIANLGRLNIPDTYGDLRIDRIIPLPGAIRDIPLTLGGVGIGGKMVFSLNYPQSKDMNGSRTREMIRVRNRAMEYLGFPGKRSEKALY